MEVEPNDQIDQALSIRGPACFEGAIAPGEQDRLIWSVPDTEDPHGWLIAYEGGYAAANVTL